MSDVIFRRTPTLGLSIIQPTIFKDFRGEYTETFNQEELASYLRFPDFVQDDVILSQKNVLRGYHGDDITWKYIMCLQGAFQLVVVNIDPESSLFLEHDTLILDDKVRECLLLPPKHVNAHMCLTDTCLFFYKQTTLYKGEKYQYTIKWNSINGVYWGTTPILSIRDRIRARHVAAYIKHDKLLSPGKVNS